MPLKQAVVVRADLKLPKGKLAVQVSHASLEAALESSRHVVEEWRGQGMTKIVLKVPARRDLFAIKKQAESAGLTTALITDAGRTVLKPGTVTCLGIGPADEAELDAITGKLKMV